MGTSPAPPGLVRPGVSPAGLLKPGLDSPGVVRPPTPVAGSAAPGVVSPGLVRPGLVPRPGLVNPGLVRPVAPVPPLRAGTGGRLIPNDERPCDSAPTSSLGRSVMTAACLNSWCSGGLVPAVDSYTRKYAQGLATATAATALMAVESLRRRRFGTEVSSI